MELERILDLIAETFFLQLAPDESLSFLRGL